MAQPSSATPGSIDINEPTQLSLDRTEVTLDTAGIVDPREEIDVFVRLDEPAVTEFVAAQLEEGKGEPSVSARRAQAQKINQQHRELRAGLARLGVPEQSALRVGANGLRVRANVQDMTRIAELPGVVSVAPVTLHEPTNDTSVPWINAPEAWEALSSTGEGIIISIIDTGIDYTHASFGGSGDVADYQFIRQDTTIIPEVDGEPVFPTAKVVDGWDFAGPNYDASGEIGDTEPQPDPNPIDVHGHGTHVAGSAAGIEVRDDDDDLLVGQGVAPGATLYAAKVFGDQAGSTALTADAIEWSLDPRGDGSMIGQAHVINMSLGNVYGRPDDASAIASQNATAVGTVVVSSAGNSGTASYNNGSPGVAPDTIAVAASIDAGYSVLGLEITEPADIAGMYEAAESQVGAALSTVPPFTGELAVADPLLACEPLANADEVAGKVALIQRGDCSFTIKLRNAEAAGAERVVVFNNEPGEPIAMGHDGIGDAPSIPGVMVSLGNGDLFMDQIDAGETVVVSMSGDIQIPRPDLADTLAPFTSAGPSRGGSQFKPDVAAPGFGISSAGVGTGVAARSTSGTSMASPHVAGLAALLAHQHGLPDIEDRDERAELVSVIKSIIMNSTVPAQDDYPLTLQGTGVVRADRAVQADAYTTPAGLSFGRVHPLASTSVTEQVTVTNLADNDRTFSVEFVTNQTVAGVSVSHDESVTVAAGGSATIEVTLSLDPAAMPADDAFFSQTEVDGWLVLADGDSTLHAGVLAVVDPAAAVEVAPQQADGETIDLAVRNPSATLGITDGFTLVGTGDDAAGVFEALGVRTATISGIDVVQFGLATDAWDSLSERTTEILLDVNGDGEFDYVLVAQDLGLIQDADPVGEVVTALFDLTTGGGALQWFVDGDYHDQTQVLTVDRTGDFGFLEPGATEFSYLATHYDGTTLIGTQAGTVNLDAVDDRLNPSVSVPAGVEGVLEFPGDDERNTLWLHRNNQIGNQYQVVPLEATEPERCDRTITRNHVGPLHINGEVVCVDGANVIGPVQVRNGGGLIASSAQLVGPVNANGAAILELDGSRVTGPVNANGVSSSLVLSGNQVTGPVSLTNNATGDNPIVLSDNRIIGPLSCQGNDPAPVNNGAPNTVTGPQSGQCAGL